MMMSFEELYNVMPTDWPANLKYCIDDVNVMTRTT